MSAEKKNFAHLLVSVVNGEQKVEQTESLLDGEHGDIGKNFTKEQPRNMDAATSDQLPFSL